jgi:hypothetical protein
VKNTISFVLFWIFFFLLSQKTTAESPPAYSKIEPILKEVWEETYPLSYTKILKKDLLGKGIIVLKTKEGLNYLYTFLVLFPKYSLQDGILSFDEKEGRKIIVKLYYSPNQIEKKYWIDLGELTEKYEKQNIVRYIK